MRLQKPQILATGGLLVRHITFDLVKPINQIYIASKSQTNLRRWHN